MQASQSGFLDIGMTVFLFIRLYNFNFFFFLPQNKTADAAEAFLSTIDKTFDFASDVIGNTLLSGYRRLENAKLSETVDTVRRDMEQAEVTKRGMKIGENAVSTSLNVLENLGMQAISVITDQSNVKKLDSIFISKRENAEISQDEDKPFSRLFEDNCGGAHLQVGKIFIIDLSIIRCDMLLFVFRRFLVQVFFFLL